MTGAETAVASTAGPVPLVEASGLHVSLADTPVLRGISLSLATGGSLALVGPNGAGKSTLLRTLAGLIRPTRGQVTVAGQVLKPNNPAGRHLVGLVGHQAMLYPELTARENLRFYARLYGLDHPHERVERGLDRLDMRRHADRPVRAMSRGMIQRLALSRAMLHEPPLLLLDEPDTGLDARAYDALATIVRKRQSGQSIVLASHDLSRVLDLAGTVAFMRAGRIVEMLTTANLTVGELRERYGDVLARRLGREQADGRDLRLVEPASPRA